MRNKFLVLGALAVLFMAVWSIGGSQRISAGEPHGVPISNTFILGELTLPDGNIVYFSIQEGTLSLKVELPAHPEVRYLSFSPLLYDRTAGAETVAWVPMGVGDFGVAQIKKDGTLMRRPSGPSNQPVAHPLAEVQEFLFDGETFRLKVVGLEGGDRSTDKTLLASGVSLTRPSNVTTDCANAGNWTVCVKS